MLTLTSEEIDYVVASFRAWCAEHHIARPGLRDAMAYFSAAPTREPFAAELIDGDWQDFVAFLQERKLLAAEGPSPVDR